MHWLHMAKLATALLRAGKINAGTTMLRELSNKEPYNAEMHYMFGKAYEEIGEIYLAINQYKKAAALNYKTPESEMAIARIYRQLGRKDSPEQADAIDGTETDGSGEKSPASGQELAKQNIRIDKN